MRAAGLYIALPALPALPVHSALPLLSALLMTGPAAARPVWNSGTYVYADLCILAASGRIGGRRITLRRSPQGDGLVYESGGGGGLAPTQGMELALDDASKALAFTAETEAGPVSFRGTLSTEALTGILHDEAGDHPVRLPRVLRSHARQACADAGVVPVASETTGSLGER
ncbi:hypothetical protein [Methylobacterium planeticum]|uniref:Uncharacterized protein n=1 Tax=Methylobacterium planeticum TaxID=2615211 RepID=A0A6N6MNX3_9HYPH|nr:hypothetical protein [Methylobacterium planeticum]KAB1073183.1 hypothetical protein F6X51_12575 [Methylobacterium planeticum]